jgi:hypothetical protein
MKTRLLIILLVIAPLVRGQTISIENDLLRVTSDGPRGTFTVERLSDGKRFIADSDLGHSGFARQYSEVLPGNVARLTVTDAIGSEVRFVLQPHDPFVRIEGAFHNSGGTVHPNEVEIVRRLVLDLDAPAARLVVRGTGGLHAASEYEPRSTSTLQALWDWLTRRKYREPTGSYEWLAIADSATRKGVVAGFITHHRATGVLTPQWTGEGLEVGIVNEFGNPTLKSGESLEVETLAIGWFDDVRLGLEKYADEVALGEQVHLPPQPAGFTTWYMEKNGGAADEKSLATLTDFIDKNLKPFGMNFVQIDDHWQSGEAMGNGPDKNFTGSNPKGPYPSGMKAAADNIRAAGLTPGLWFLPFSGEYKDPWFADKQGLFVKTRDGKPYETEWAGTSLDMTNPAAQAYVQGIVTNIVHNWGFSYLKIDGLFAGLAAQQVYVNSDYTSADDFGNAVFANPDKTNIEAFRDGLKLVRAAAGPGVFILGCNTAQNMRVFGGSMGLVDAMRIGPDNERDIGEETNVGPPKIEVSWKTWRDASPVFGSWEYFLNGRLWYNDPDPNYVRATLTLDEARTEASWSSVSGQLFTSSDWLPDLPPERLDIIKRTVAPHGKLARPVDFLENDPPRVWQVIDDTPGARRDVVALFNFDDAPLTINVPLDRFDLPKAPTYAAFDFWAEKFLPPVKDAITATLPPHACQILALRPMLDHPFVISTSRHVTQGMIDLSEEAWDPKTRTLTGKSRVVGGDPYYLRIVIPEPATNWAGKDFSIDEASKTSGASTAVTDGLPLSVEIRSPSDQVISWALSFR